MSEKITKAFTEQFTNTYNAFAAWQTVCINLLDMRDAYPV